MLNLTGTLELENSRLITAVRTGATGKGSNITIRADRVLLSKASRIEANTLGDGIAGSITVTAPEITLSGVSNTATPTTIGSTTTSSRNAGNVTIKTQKFTLQDGAFVGIGTLGAGNGGTLTIETQQLSLLNGGQLGNNTDKSGNAGATKVVATEFINIISGDSGIPTTITSQTLGQGRSGAVDISTGRLQLLKGGTIASSTFGAGSGGTVTINATESVEVTGVSNPGVPLPPGANSLGANSAIFTEARSSANAGNLNITTKRLTVRDGADISTATRPLPIFGSGGNAGDITIRADLIEVVGTALQGQTSSDIISSTSGDGGIAGQINLYAQTLRVAEGGSVIATSRGRGNAGSINVVANLISLEDQDPSGSPSGIKTGTLGLGRGGDITVQTDRLQILRGASIDASTIGGTQRGGDIQIKANQISISGRGRILTGSEGNGKAGNIELNASRLLETNDGKISTSSLRTLGGNIFINAEKIRLSGSSEISAFVGNGESGGNIVLTARSIIALDDSDILAFALRGNGGNITLSTPAFFGFRYNRANSEANPLQTLNNGRVDINASGTLRSGTITLQDNSFIQNSLNQLPQNAIDTNTLLANTCITRNKQNGTFFITGTGGLPTNPVDLSTYPTGTVQAVGSDWKRGNAIVEPQGVYQLPNGTLVLSRECS